MVVGFSHRLAYALALSLLVWNLYVLPVGMGGNGGPVLLSLANAPVGAAALLVPCPARGIDAPFLQCHHQGGQSASEFFLSHLRVAVPVYMFLFYLPFLLRRAKVWLSRLVGRAKEPDAATRVP